MGSVLRLQHPSLQVEMDLILHQLSFEKRYLRSAMMWTTNYQNELGRLFFRTCLSMSIALIVILSMMHPRLHLIAIAIVVKVVWLVFAFFMAIV
jgi:hypothetical protein